MHDTKVTCDMCGKEIGKFEEYASLEKAWHNLDPNRNVPLVYRRDTIDSCHNNSAIDLCKSCYDDFWKTLRVRHD